MKTVNTVIIDDEEHNRNVLKTLLNKHCSHINVIGEAASAIEGYEKITALKPELIFLDIKMPNKSGFELLKMFSAINFEVIFVSAFNEYAITAFDFNALGYILKPVDNAKLIRSVDKAVSVITLNQKTDDVFYFIKTIEDKKDQITKIPIHHNDKVIFITIKDIISVETKNDICELKLKDNLHYYSSKDLKLFEGILSEDQDFVRINKSVIINTNFIRSYSKGITCVLEMENGFTHEVSRRKKTEVLSRIKI